MAEIKTRADSLRMYHTGAAADGNAQTDPNLSLGNFRSSTRMTATVVAVTSPIANVTVDFVSAENGTGAGSLTATGVNDLKWTPPGGTQGVAVTIANGETKILEAGGSEPQKYIQVTRTSATALTGTATVTITNPLNNVAGFDDLSSAEASAGDTEYRCLAIKNEATVSITGVTAKIGTLGTQRVSNTTQLGVSGAGTIESSTGGAFDDWPATGWAAVKTDVPALREIVYYSSRTATVLTVPSTGRAQLGTSAAAGAATDTVDAVPGIAIGLDAPTSQPSGSFVDNTGAGEGTAPAAVTFVTPYTDAEAASIGTLATLEIYGIWIKREVPAATQSNPAAIQSVVFNYDAA